MGQITADQSQQIIALLSTNVDWSTIDFEVLDLQQSVILNPKEAGEQFQAFLMNRCRVVFGKLPIIPINRTIPFNPAEFLDEGWSFWRGPADGNGLEGELEQDSRSLALTEVDLSKILLEAHLKSKETSTTGEERMRRLVTAGRIRLDLGVFKTLWNNKTLIPSRFKKRINDNRACIHFDGQPLRDPDGCRCTLYMCWHGSRGWRYSLCMYSSDRQVYDLSASLAS